ncbi:MAG TPA: polysaccharide deacetylase family protein [Iamia sp.]|nr:polysaccharide deacetylase family protein [Iamia sp.]
MPAPVPVLLYHGVAPSAPPGLQPWVMHPDRFAAHLDLIVARGLTPLRVSDLVDAYRGEREMPERPVVITFDDGLADFAEHAWPALRERDLTATLYVVAGALGGTADWLDDIGGPPPAMLTWDQVRALDAEGCEIGAHSLTHPELDTLRRRAIEDEVSHSRREISTHLGAPVRSFAYPHGYHDRRVRAAVVAAGYDSACAVREALSSRDDDTLALARVTLLHDVEVDGLAAVLDGRDHPVAPFPEPIRTKAWRVARRVGAGDVVAAVDRARRGRAA